MLYHFDTLRRTPFRSAPPCVRGRTSAVRVAPREGAAGFLASPLLALPPLTVLPRLMHLFVEQQPTPLTMAFRPHASRPRSVLSGTSVFRFGRASLLLAPHQECSNSVPRWSGPHIPSSPANKSNKMSNRWCVVCCKAFLSSHARVTPDAIPAIPDVLTRCSEGPGLILAELFRPDFPDSP